jgi:OOP family OmpA-OmpF porin
MKKLVLFVFTAVSMGTFAQSFTENLYFDLNVGTRIGGTTSDSSSLGAGLHLEGGVGYELNELYAIKGDLGFDTYNAQDAAGTKEDKSLGIRGSIQGVVNVSDLAGFGTETFGLKFHGGFGFYTISNPSFKDSYTTNVGEFSDPGFKGNDDMINFIFGLNPQYHLTEQLSVNADLSLVLLAKQSNYLDRVVNNTVNNGMGNLFNASVGISFKL